MDSFRMVKMDAIRSEENRNIVSDFVMRNLCIKFKEGGDQMFLLVLSGTELVGLGYVSCNVLKYLCVEEEYRNKGIGKRIVRKFLETYASLDLYIPVVASITTDESEVSYVNLESTAVDFYTKNFRVLSQGVSKMTIAL